MIRVYRYGLLRPTENADLVNAQMRAGHNYRNTLTAIERARRAVVRAAEVGAGDLPALEAALVAAKTTEIEASQAIKQARAASRSRSETEVMRDTLRRARAARSEIARSLREARVAARQAPELLHARDQIQERYGALRRSARTEATAGGLYWGTYQLSEAEAEAAKRMPLYDGLEPNDPKFIRWNGDGRIGVQIQGGMDTGEIFGSKGTLLQIAPVDGRAWHSPVRGERRRASRTTLRIRIGSSGPGNREPIWAVFPMIMHRPLPPGTIKTAVVSRTMIGPREEWSVVITVDLAEDTRTRPAGGVVAIDIGWRLVYANRMRVATWVGDDGQQGELQLSAHLINGLRKPEELRSVRDGNFNTARDRLVKWISWPTVSANGLILGGFELPAWLKEKKYSHIFQWRSFARLTALVLRWRENRFTGDEEIYAALEAWRYHDHHLWCWETSQRTGALRYRREVYRCFAAELAKKYRTVVLEKFDLRRVAVRPTTEASAVNETARSSRQLAATSTLRDALLQAMAAHSPQPAAHTTTDCHACDHRNEVAQETLVQKCEQCGVQWDVDVNACHNLLRLHRESLGGSADPEVARSDALSQEMTDSKWSQARKMRAERAARLKSRG